MAEPRSEHGSPAEVALRMRGIEKRFGAVVALAGVDLELRRGEVHALIGENGAGKSTLMKVLSGAHAPDAGHMELAGVPYAPRHPREARELGVAMIYQELTLAPHLSVAQNIVLGREPRRFGVLDRAAMAARVDAALAWLAQAELDPARPVAELSPGAQQLVEIARALSGEARVVVMDEPTSSLARPEAERLFAIIERLCARGVAVIYISHFLEEVERVAQRYTVLRDGRSVESGEVARASGRSPRANASASASESAGAGASAGASESAGAGASGSGGGSGRHGASGGGFVARVIEAMVGRALGDVFPQVSHQPGEVVLELEALAGARLPRAASLVLRRGEILGLAGLVGAGRSELLRALFGLDPVRSGRVRVGSVADPGDKRPWQRLAQGVGLLSEDRKREGLALGLSIADNLTLSRPLARFGVIAQGARAAATRAFAAQLALRYESADQPVAQLSGGNQQKVALARLLHHDVDVLLLDEPTRGVDVASKIEIYRLIGALAARGKAILVVSSYLPELLGICDQIAVMTRGVLGEARPRAAWSEASLLEAATRSETAPGTRRPSDPPARPGSA